ncbi:NAD(P)H-hydrate dehydratase [uncultured Megasphaera sp.]|uniref:NAD(P)H-hydrate dehydratase n=1 Tax=uncultured Megasphaera sp. TaxID=165188 RepID=UPI0025993508|nr:NAD(P)H-hydrate dehydratase [uncultured Megasphaera sp.]
MKKLNTAAQMKAIDREAMQGRYQIPPTVLMENAGHAVVTHGMQVWGPWQGKRVIIFCGAGNNGGDGFVIARHLMAQGAKVYVYIWGEESAYSEESRIHLRTLQVMQDDPLCHLQYLSSLAEPVVRRRIAHSHMIIDALIGTGFHGMLRPKMRALAQIINAVAHEAKIPVIAVDMPTGVDADTGASDKDAIHATMTVTFGVHKRGQFIYPGKELVGKVVLDTIGMPVPLLRKEENDCMYALELADIAEIMTKRSPTSHKGTHGTVGIIAGSATMLGAALMAAQGAVRAGAGKVRAMIPSVVATQAMGLYPEIMVAAIGTTPYFTGADSKAVMERIRDCSIIALGPGLGRSKETQDFVLQILEKASCPLVIDADGLYHLQGMKDRVRRCLQPLIFTPHIAEFSHLSGYEIDAIKTNPVPLLRAFAQEWQVCIVLKGAPTYIVSSEGKAVYINTTGNAGMACGGMGDVLTGMVAAIWGRENNPTATQAACAAVYLHGASGDACAKDYGPYGYTPLELARQVPRILQQGQGVTKIDDGEIG